MKKKNSGITLVALVITIIVLIILAGVSINAVMNDGLIGNANAARDEFQKGKYKEEDALGYLDALAEYVDVKITNVNTAETNPAAALPEGAVIIEGDANKGIVIKDSNNNEWVWVEVPKSIYTTATSSTDYTNIETDMQTYATDYRRNNSSDAYFSGCGFASSTDYNNQKNSMLKSVYENGGFWVGRYEAGTRIARYNRNDELTDVVVQQDVYPYNWVTVSQAQERATTLATGGRTSSLMFGIQWDLIMKFIETKGYLTGEDGIVTTTKVTKDMLTTDSTSFGNYKISTFTINRGKYFRGYPYNEKDKVWIAFDDTEDTSNFVINKQKQENSLVILTAGACNRNRVMNIYDIAGNVNEWTLECSSDYDGKYTARGNNGLYGAANTKQYCSSNRQSRSNVYDHYGFRTCLW